MASVAFVPVGGGAEPAPSDGNPLDTPRVSHGIVDHVADGDTFTLRSGARVRIIGIDAPEEYFGKHDCGRDRKSVV